MFPFKIIHRVRKLVTKIVKINLPACVKIYQHTTNYKMHWVLGCKTKMNPGRFAPESESIRST